MKHHKKYYDKLISDSDIGKIAVELMADRITSQTPDILYCNCPHHVSESDGCLTEPDV